MPSVVEVPNTFGKFEGRGDQENRAYRPSRRQKKAFRNVVAGRSCVGW